MENIKPEEVLVDPKPVEELKVDEVTQDLLNRENSLKGATDVFSRYYPVFSRNLERFSRKSLKRIIRTVVANPIEELSINPKSKDEMDMCMLIEKLMEAKMVIVLQSLYKHQEELDQKIKQTETEAKVEGSTEAKVETKD